METRRMRWLDMYEAWGIREMHTKLWSRKKKQDIKTFGTDRHWRQDTIKAHLVYVEWRVGVDWIQVTENRVQQRAIVITVINPWVCEISSSHGGEYDVQSCLLGCTAVMSNPWWWRQYAPQKRRSTINLHGSTTQKTALNNLWVSLRAGESNVVGEWLTLLLRIRDVPGSNLDTKTGNPD
jgi:hypothetical protein